MLKPALLAFMFAASGAAAADCARPMPAGSGAPVPATGIDQALFSASMHAAASAYRCSERRAEVAEAPLLTQLATRHAACMARTHKLSHGGAGTGCDGIRERLQAAGLAGRRASENIATVPRFGGPGRPFRVIDASRCVFAAPDGSRMPVHSYASLATEAVALFASSSGHARNLFDRQVGHTGSGVALDRTAPYCGQYYISQVFLR